MDLFLKFESEEQALQELYDIIPAVKNDNGEVVQQQQLHQKFKNIDTIGKIFKPTGEIETGKDGMPIPVMEEIDGWHVNIRLVGEDASSILKFSTQPKNPVRIWA